MANPTSLNDALKLYEILGNYVPTLENTSDDYLEFMQTVIANIEASGNYQAYFDAIEVMTGATYNTLTSSTPDDVLHLFMNGMIEWRIIELVQFFRGIGYHHD